MLLTPKTIQIFLPGGDPRGIRVAEITTRIVQVIEVPRSLLQDFLKMPESSQVGLYFLFGPEEEGADPQVYIGQTGNLGDRLKKHNKDEAKDFWQKALVLISMTQNLTQTHTLYLEWHAIAVAKEVGRYSKVNGNSGSKPYTPAPLEADCAEIFETGRTLLATLGYPVFEPLSKSDSASGGLDTYQCEASGAKAQGQYTSEGFVVLKGSIGRLENVRSIQGTSIEKMRLKLLESGVMKPEGETVVFQQDHLFPSPSAAAQAVLGRTSNGWIEWKRKDGKTLDQVERQETEEQA